MDYLLHTRAQTTTCALNMSAHDLGNQLAGKSNRQWGIIYSRNPPHSCAHYYVNTTFVSWVMFVGGLMAIFPRTHGYIYAELASGSQGVACLQLCYKDVCKCDMMACNIDTKSWELIVENRTLWTQQVSHGLQWEESAICKVSHQNKEVTTTES